MPSAEFLTVTTSMPRTLRRWRDLNYYRKDRKEYGIYVGLQVMRRITVGSTSL